MIKIISPLLIILPRKTKPDKKYYLNLNNYNNWHYRIYQALKKEYCKLMYNQLIFDCFKLETPIELKFTLFPGDKRKRDRANILCIIEKFFCDALVEWDCIPDDSDAYILSSHYYTGELDRKNPRCEIFITHGGENEKTDKSNFMGM